MNHFIALPILIPLLAAVVLLLLPTARSRSLVSIAASLVTLAIDLVILTRVLGGEVLVSQMGSWPAPFGITLVADGLAAVMIVLSGVTGLLTVVFAGSSLQHAPHRALGGLLNRARETYGAQALLQFLFMGVHMSFLTGDLFNLFVAFEVLLVASYALLLLGGELPQLREGFRYVVVNLLASAIFVGAAGMAYGLFGTLNMADIAQRLAEHGPDQRVTAIAALLALAFSVKAALFPLGFWLPNSYPVPAAAVSAFFAALLTKVGVYALIRIFTLMFPEETGLRSIILVLAGFTLLFGALGTIVRHRWRYVFSFANIASIGYLLAGAFIGSRPGLEAALYYMVNSVLVIFSLFLVAALAEIIGGLRFRSSGHLGLYPWLAGGYFFAMLALSGMPPTSGFIGKFAIIESLLAVGGTAAIFVATVAVIAGLLLLYAGVEIFRHFFWGEADAVHRVKLPRAMSYTAGTAIVLLAALALFSGPVYSMASLVADQLGSNSAYLQAVLTPTPEVP
ncbi:MAG TPA: proton-conducting transporter membrane subunit [Trueperaceae bacterium]